ncbi:type I secretion system ATPase [alpha proteobacterium U9-1i]|nr:type I secretion system ATPase [alpha proteobacterium U9-1i]
MGSTNEFFSWLTANRRDRPAEDAEPDTAAQPEPKLLDRLRPRLPAPVRDAGRSVARAGQWLREKLWRWPPFGGDEENGVSEPVAPSDVIGAARRGIKRHIALIIAFSAGINILYLAPSLFMLQVYDRVLPTGATLTLVLISVVMIAALAVMAQLDSLRARLLARASLRVERLAGRAIMEEALAARRRAPSGAPPAGMRELDLVRQAISSPATIGLLDLPWTPLFIFICFVLHFWIGVMAVAGAAIIFTIAMLNERASRKALSSLGGKTAQFYIAHDTDLQSAESLRALGAENAVLSRRLRLRDTLTDSQADAGFVGADFSALTKVVRLGLQSAALGLGAWLAIERQISPGAIIAASILTARAFAPVEQIVGGWRQVAMGFTAYKSLRTMFEGAEPRQPRTPLPAPAGRIQLEAVSAGPPGAQLITLSNVSFSAQPGEIIGIVGPSGAGKTTLARVLANAATPRSGAVRIDGARFVDWDSKALSRYIGYLPQRVDLFDGTVAENIACFAREEGQSMEDVGAKVVEAAQLAGAHDLILALPNGYETMLGQNGSGISPGQAQRIALARALYNSPTLIVLDEPNAHLDSDGEAALLVALQSSRARGAVCFVIAHRAGVLGIVDKVMVLNKGMVVEYGPRDNVLAALQQRNNATKQPAKPEGAHQ